MKIEFFFAEVRSCASPRKATLDISGYAAIRRAAQPQDHLLGRDGKAQLFRSASKSTDAKIRRTEGSQGNYGQRSNPAKQARTLSV